jgi:hypothetical protein
MSLNDVNARVQNNHDQRGKADEQINYQAGVNGNTWSATWNNSLVILENFAETYSRAKAKANSSKSASGAFTL